MKSKETLSQLKFMEASGQTTDKFNFEQFELYLDLVEEEALEMFNSYNDFVSDSPELIKNKCLEGIIDGLVDVVVTAKGALISLGVDVDSAMEEVWKSNLSKIQPNGTVIKREDGKVMKPPTYIPPDFSRFVEGMDYTDTKSKYSVK